MVALSAHAQCSSCQVLPQRVIAYKIVAICRKISPANIYHISSNRRCGGVGGGALPNIPLRQHFGAFAYKQFGEAGVCAHHMIPDSKGLFSACQTFTQQSWALNISFRRVMSHTAMLIYSTRHRGVFLPCSRVIAVMLHHFSNASQLKQNYEYDFTTRE